MRHKWISKPSGASFSACPVPIGMPKHLSTLAHYFKDFKKFTWSTNNYVFEESSEMLNYDKNNYVFHAIEVIRLFKWTSVLPLRWLSLW